MWVPKSSTAKPQAAISASNNGLSDRPAWSLAMATSGVTGYAYEWFVFLLCLAQSLRVNVGTTTSSRWLAFCHEAVDNATKNRKRLVFMIEMPFLWGLAALVGAAVGSFITLVTHRLPLGEAIGMTRSRCPKCKHVLGLCDLMPVLSWLFARGRWCRHCHARISMRYPLTEPAPCTGVCALLLAGFTLEALAPAGLWWCVVAIFVTDLEPYHS